MTHKDFPPKLVGPRIEPDKPHIRLEINCICGRTLEAATYMDGGLIKMVIAPCVCTEVRK